MKTAVIGFPRIGTLRELKFASEKYFRKEIGAEELLQTAGTLKKTHWKTQEAAGIDYISSNDFSFYDMVLDTAALLNTSNGDVSIELPINMLSAAYGFYLEDFDSVMIISEGNEYCSQVAADAIRVVETRHNIRGENLIQVQSFAEQMDEINSMMSMVTLFVVFVAAISLLVGGIGVMNIMLVSVTERTREIGIRKSLGARTSSILVQFLSESAIITLLGGIVGIILGVAGAVAVCGAMGFSASIHLSTVLGASLFSSAVGIFFGLYPAKRAAKLSPIEALRHE